MAALIQGAVVDADGRAVAGAAVYVVSAPAAMPDIAARTDARGQFTLSAPVPGDYTLAATAEGFTTASAPVAVVDGAGSFEVTITVHVHEP